MSQLGQSATLPATRFAELHYDNTGTDTGEAIEIEGPAGTDLTGWSIVLYDGNGGAVYNTKALTGTIPATCDTRGVAVFTYPTNGIQNGSPDGMALVDNSGAVVEFLSYEGTFTAVGGAANGRTSVDIIASEPSTTPIGQSLQRDNNDVWTLATSSFGACNPSSPPPPANTVSFSGRVASDPALPVGFQDQLFATERTAAGGTVTTTFTWSSDSPTTATIDQNGVFTSLAAGTAILRATAADGTTGTVSLPTRVGVASTTASYVGNAEFGEPTDADSSDDFIVRHAEFTASYNKNRGGPNWVAYNMDATAFGAEDRCDCFTFDPDLPADFPRLTTNDYTGAGAIAGFGIDRGHMTRSFDRTSSSLDNARTFLFSNVLPQAADLNQGPWANLENFLGDLARLQNKEVYIITGGTGNAGTLKNEGKVVIPTSTWKVAVIMDRDKRLADIHDYRDLQVIAVNMPNVAGVRNVDWHTYQTTVDAIESLTGYDLLALLPDNIENAVEAGIQPPIAAIDGPYAGAEGGTIAVSAAASIDPNGTVTSYAWTFGDGGTATGATASHTYAQDGTYTVSVTVTDNDGLTDTITTTATIANVAPAISTLPGANLNAGDTYSATGAFIDPGADTWTATVDYGDGGGPSPLTLAGNTFALSHRYASGGAFTVTVRVSDDDVTSTATASVTVAGAANPTITTSQTSYAATDTVTAIWSGLPGNAHDWIGLAPAGSDPATVLRWVYTGGAAAGSAAFGGASLAPGSYVARAFVDDSYTVLAESAFTVTASTAVTVAADQAIYALGSLITVSWTGLSTSATNWIAIAPVGSPDTTVTRWAYTGGQAAGSHAFESPLAPGMYVARAFADDSYVKTGESLVFVVQ